MERKMRHEVMMNKSGLAIMCIITLVLSSYLVTADLTLHALNGHVYMADGSNAPNNIPVFVNLTSANHTYNLLTYGPPPSPNNYAENVNGSDGETVIVQAWNDTHYGQNQSALVASPGSTTIEVHINETRDSETNVSIEEPTANKLVNQWELFNVTANITILGNDATGCEAEITFLSDNVVRMKTGESTVNSLGDISRNRSVNTTFQLQGYRAGSVNISINASCDTDGVKLQNSTIDYLFNVTVTNVPPRLDFVSPTPADLNVSSTDYFYVNVSTSDLDDTYAFIDWNFTTYLWMMMDHTSGAGVGETVYDNSSQGNDGGIEGSATQTDNGRFNNGFNFGGEDFIIVVGVHELSDKNFTVSAWFMNNESGSQGIVICQADGIGAGREWLYLDAGDVINTKIGGDALSSGVTTVESRWYHAAITYDNTTGNLSIYVNGSIMASEIDQFEYGNGDIFIGIDTDGSSNGWNGTIDEVMIFERVLSEQEIKALYNATENSLYRNFTNLSGGNYNYTAYVVDAEGSVNSSGRNTTIHTNDAPVIHANASYPTSPIENEEVYLWANVTDDGTIQWVNFTVIAPNGTIIIDCVNASSNKGDIWNSSKFNITDIGTWLWNITAYDGTEITTDKGNFTINAWHIIYGNITGSLALMNSAGFSLITWNVTNVSGSNVFATDSDNSISFNSLLAFSRNTSGSYVSDDFGELDTQINMTSLNDSVNSTFTSGGNPILVNNFTIYGTNIQNVPVINSTNSSSFRTGILWDSSDDDGDGEFDLTDIEDVVFITAANDSTQGEYGTYDFEIKIPAKLRRFNTTNVLSVTIYAEIR